MNLEVPIATLVTSIAAIALSMLQWSLKRNLADVERRMQANDDAARGLYERFVMVQQEVATTRTEVKERHSSMQYELGRLRESNDRLDERLEKWGAYYRGELDKLKGGK